MIRLFTRILLVVFSLFAIISCQQDIFPEMVYISGGEFILGCDSLGDADESPAHCVFVKPFFIGKYEVTQEEWNLIMKRNPSEFKGSKRPVECVSWDDALLFIARLNDITGEKYRLPTEAEWEYVAKCGYDLSATTDSLSYIGWWLGNSDSTTHEVGLLRPNKFGVYDMIGNVHEWCADLYDSLAYAKSAGVIPNDSAFQSNEVVAKGGNWISQKQFTRITNRNHAPLDYRNSTVGFRLAMDVE